MVLATLVHVCSITTAVTDHGSTLAHCREPREHPPHNVEYMNTQHTAPPSSPQSPPFSPPPPRAAPRLSLRSYWSRSITQIGTSWSDTAGGLGLCLASFNAMVFALSTEIMLRWHVFRSWRTWASIGPRRAFVIGSERNPDSTSSVRT